MSDAPQITRTLTAEIADIERWIAETEERLINAGQDLATFRPPFGFQAERDWICKSMAGG